MSGRLGRWQIRDSGRGLRQEHFTEKEDAEKLAKPGLVIGKFGFGLKDAVAALERRAVGVRFRSRHADITVTRLPKHGLEEPGSLQTHAAPRPAPSKGLPFPGVGVI